MACSARSSHMQQFNSWLIYFPLSSLLMSPGKKWKSAQGLGPYTHRGRLEEAPGFGLGHPWSPWPFGERTSRWKTSLLVCLPLFLQFCLSKKFKINNFLFANR